MYALLDGIQPNERCFDPELDSGLMNEGRRLVIGKMNKATRLIVWKTRRILENGMDMVCLLESQNMDYDIWLYPRKF